MPSITGRKADLEKLAKRLRAVAEAIKHLPANPIHALEEWEVLRKEVKAIAAQLRGKGLPSQ